MGQVAIVVKPLDLKKFEINKVEFKESDKGGYKCLMLYI